MSTRKIFSKYPAVLLVFTVFFMVSVLLIIRIGESAARRRFYITREQVAVMLMGYYKSSGKTVSIDLSVLDKFTDTNKISSWARTAINWAVNNKIMSGIGNGKLDPKGTCTRAQLAQFIKNYWSIKDNEPGEVNPPVVEPDIDPIVKALIGDTQPLDKNWLPVGGYTQGGRKYNMYGIDITDVDGIPTTEEARLVNMINDYRAQNGLPRLQWNQHAQMLAEVRAREGAYNYAHTRPDGTAHVFCESNIGRQHLTSKNALMAEELKITDAMIDPSMVAIGKITDMTTNNKFPQYAENMNKGTGDSNKADRSFNAWKNSPGHNNTMLRSMTDLGSSAYAACAIYYNSAENFYIASYDAYGIDWVDPAAPVEPTPPPKYDPEPNEDWYPGKGINYGAVGFELSDIPAEYPDWILRDPEMDIEFYGPTDHDINSLEAWLVDNGVDEYSDLMYQVKAHFFSTLSMDEYVKYMFSNTDVFHYTNLMPDGFFPIDELDGYDIAIIKGILVENVADKLAYEHMLEGNVVQCSVCGKNHNELRDLSAAETIVNRFFVDYYGFDISAY